MLLPCLMYTTNQMQKLQLGVNSNCKNSLGIPLLFLEYLGCLLLWQFASNVLTSPTALVVSYYVKMTKLLQIQPRFIGKQPYISS